MYSRKIVLAAVSAIVFAASSGPSYAQTSKGILTGEARDQTGAILANATISVVSQDTGESRTVQTSTSGSYRIDAINPGRYTITASAATFQKAVTKDVLVNASVVTSYDIVLTVGSASSEVTIEANQATINTDNGELSGVVGSYEIDKLPIFSLNPYELATTVPGVQIVRSGAFSNGFDVQINGARPRANNFLLDGQEINDVGIGGQAFQPQIPDIFDSLNVITSSASAEFGRASGGIVNLVTKSGTNIYHGTAFERYTGSGLNARTGNQRLTNSRKPRFDQHSYGFTGGGRILRDKLFVFGALELQRFYGTTLPPALTLPDAAGYAQLQAIGGPQVTLLDQYLLNGAYLTQATVTPTLVAPVPVGVQNGCPNGCSITRALFQRPAVPQTSPDTQWMYRVDYRPGSRDSFFVRYLHDRSSFSPDFGNSGGTLPGFETQQGGPAELGNGGWTHIFTPALLNEFRASETRINFQFQATPAAQANPVYQLPTIAGVGISALGPNQNFPQGRKEDLYQFQDTIGITKGKHSLRIGTDIGRQIEIDLVSQNAKGTLTFAAGGPQVGGGAYGSGLADFLQNQLGAGGTASKAFGSTRVDSHLWRSGVFVQDDWKVSPDLSLNFGVRYDYFTDPENSLAFPAIDVNNPFALLTPLANPVMGGATAQANYIPVNKDRNNVGPRVGFAYSPHSGGIFANGKTVIRGGFGVFYDSTFSNILVNSAQAAPNGVSGLLTSTSSVPLNNATGQLANILPQLRLTSTVTTEDKNFVNPVTYEYNLGIETEIPGQIVLSVRYVGNTGKKLFGTNDFNYFTGTTGLRLDPTRGAIAARGNYAGSNYNGLEVDGSHNFSHGFLIRANYVFSHDLDNGSEVFALGSPSSRPSNLGPNGRLQDYGNSSYDHRQNASITYVWSPKGLSSSNFVSNSVLGILTRHWTLSGVEQFQSGGNSSLQINGFDTNGDGNTANDRPIVNNRVPGTSVAVDGHFIGGGNGFFYDLGTFNTTGNRVAANPTAYHFVIPFGPIGQYQKLASGRNTYHNPGSQTHNLALEKGIGLSYLHFERATLNLRAEVQNIGNHNNLGTLGNVNTDVTTVGGQTFLNPSQTLGNDGRQLILWGKFIF